MLPMLPVLAAGQASTVVRLTREPEPSSSSSRHWMHLQLQAAPVVAALPPIGPTPALCSLVWPPVLEALVWVPGQ